MENLILVFNCGSSSLKGAVIDFKSGETLLSCLAEKLNLADAYITTNYQGEKVKTSLTDNPTHEGAITALMTFLQKVDLVKKIKAVGHRVVHGGEQFSAAVVINDAVIKGISDCVVLAPLHNPANLLGIKTAMRIFTDIKHVAVFDTAFHQTMQPAAFLYGLPQKYYQDYGVRKYGMHGTSYAYISDKARRYFTEATEFSGFNPQHMVIAHLGNGASLCAVKDGKSVDTTMGLTPLEGLLMGTRSGDIDPSIFSFLAANAGMSVQDTTNLLYYQSGLLGVSGLSSDLRTITEAAANGNERAGLAIDMFVYRLVKHIAGMIAALGAVDTLIFTGGIGENSALVREKVLHKLAVFGFKLDKKANAAGAAGGVSIITAAGVKPLALVIPTQEELMIARETVRVIGLDAA